MAPPVQETLFAKSSMIGYPAVGKALVIHFFIRGDA